MNSMQEPANNNKALVIQNTVDFVKNQLRNAEAGHDWWHILRVWKNTRLILQTQEADHLVCELAALLHDIADAKFHHGDEEIGPRTAENFLRQEDLTEPTITHVVRIIRNMSFKDSIEGTSFHSLEMEIVQDADRLDALGAIGIARAFHYGGYKNREIYNPDIPPQAYLTKAQYQDSRAPTLNHFYEKLLRLKDLMHTQTARRIAEQRHAFMESFLQQFYGEWDGEGSI